MASPLSIGPYAHGPQRSLLNPSHPKQSQTPTIMAQGRKMQNGRAHPLGIWEAFLGRGVGANPGRKGESAEIAGREFLAEQSVSKDTEV